MLIQEITFWWKNALLISMQVSQSFRRDLHHSIILKLPYSWSGYDVYLHETKEKSALVTSNLFCFIIPRRQCIYMFSGFRVYFFFLDVHLNQNHSRMFVYLPQYLCVRPIVCVIGFVGRGLYWLDLADFRWQVWSYQSVTQN